MYDDCCYIKLKLLLLPKAIMNKGPLYIKVALSATDKKSSA